MCSLGKPVSMVVLPENDYSPVMNSRAMCNQSLLGIGRGLRNPAGKELDVLFRAQVGQTKSWTSKARDGHQNRLCNIVRCPAECFCSGSLSPM